jgi:hypothetical protein
MVRLCPRHTRLRSVMSCTPARWRMVFQLKEESESFRVRDTAASNVDKVERPSRWQFALVAACFLVSGFAALLYETVWLRQFAVLLGTSEQALAIVWPWDRIGAGLGTTEQILASILILLPTATCVGLSFPFAIRALARDQTQAATASAKIYSLSTFGGIFGALRMAWT